MKDLSNIKSLKNLKPNEKIIYLTCFFSSGIITISDLKEITTLADSTISLALKSLEKKNYLYKGKLKGKNIVIL